MKRTERRNRKIGTAASGYRRGNEMRIPEPLLDAKGRVKMFWERIDAVRRDVLSIGGSQVILLYEPPRDGFTYGCSPEDVAHVLKSAAPHVPALPDIVAFRQPTRKEATLAPVWGRFLYGAEISGDAGTAILLEAQEIGDRQSWPKNLSPGEQDEIARLHADGHEITRTRRAHVFHLTPSSIRSTLLYRTLLHELGHMVQYHEDVLSTPEDEYDDAWNFHCARSSDELERFAHDTADRLATRLRDDGQIPFDPL